MLWNRDELALDKLSSNIVSLTQFLSFRKYISDKRCITIARNPSWEKHETALQYPLNFSLDVKSFFQGPRPSVDIFIMKAVPTVLESVIHAWPAFRFRAKTVQKENETSETISHVDGFIFLFFSIKIKRYYFIGWQVISSSSKNLNFSNLCQVLFIFTLQNNKKI